MFEKLFGRHGENTNTEQVDFTPRPEIADGDAEYLKEKFEEILALIDVDEAGEASAFEHVRAIALAELKTEIEKSGNSALNPIFEAANHAQTPRQLVDALQKLPPPVAGTEREPILQMIAGI